MSSGRIRLKLAWYYNRGTLHKSSRNRIITSFSYDARAANVKSSDGWIFYRRDRATIMPSQSSKLVGSTGRAVGPSAIRRHGRIRDKSWSLSVAYSRIQPDFPMVCINLIYDRAPDSGKLSRRAQNVVASKNRRRCALRSHINNSPWYARARKKSPWIVTLP